MLIEALIFFGAAWLVWHYAGKGGLSSFVLGFVIAYLLHRRK
jgi:hypothetical protein